MQRRRRTAYISGEQITRYDYNAWGSPDMYDGQDFGEVGEANPLRYRGYYFDTETYMYYLNSRYYHPEYHRFISADSVLGANGDVLSYNLFTYCSNNPVMFSDPSGMKMEPTNNWLVVALVTIGECAKVNHVYEITVARNREKGIEGGDMRAFDYPNGYNALVDELFNEMFDVTNALQKSFNDFITTALGSIGEIVENAAGIISAAINYYNLMLQDRNVHNSPLLTSDEKNTLDYLLGIPGQIQFLGRAIMTFPGLGTAIGAAISFGGSVLDNNLRIPYVDSIKNNWYAVI